MTYVHTPCDTAIIEGRDKDACAGCQSGVGRHNPAPTWADVPQGFYPEMTGGMSPEDYIAHGRGCNPETAHLQALLAASQAALRHALDTADNAIREATVLREERDRALYERDTARAGQA